MKKKITFLFGAITLWCLGFSCFAARSYEMELLNLQQISECEFRFDVRFRNTSATPAVDYISVEMMQFQVNFNTDLLNGGNFTYSSSNFCTFVTGSSDLTPQSLLQTNPCTDVAATSNITPVSGNVTSDNTVVQWVTQALGANGYTVMIDHNNWVRVGTFKVILKSATGVSTNFASVLPNLTLEPTGVLCNWCQVNSMDPDPGDESSYGGYQRAGSDFELITDKTLTNSTVNTPLYSHAFSGTGNWSTAANWNTTVGATDVSYHVVPTVATNNVSIGKYTTATVPAKTAGICTMDQNATVSNLTVGSTSSLTMNPGKQLTVSAGLNNTGTVNLSSDNTNGTATILTPATISGDGAYNVQQYLASGRNWYISSPIEAGTVSDISTTGTVVSRNEAAVSWPVETTTLTRGKGYIADHPTAGVITFDGKINAGEVQIPLTYGGASYTGYNLVGNPYPSYFSWTTASATSANVLSTIWYRAASSFYTYNASGNISSGAADLGAIPPMQAFWVKSNAAGTLTFDNSLRSHAVGTSILRSTDDKQMLRLQVSNGKNVDEAVIYTSGNALNTFENYDSPKMTNSDVEIPEIFTMIGNEKLVINGYNEIALNTEMPLGFTTGQANSFTLSATELSFNNDVKILLKDKLLGIEKVLNVGTTYNFDSDVTSSANRFSLLFKAAKDITDLKENEISNIEVFRNENNQITVRCVNLNEDAFATVYSLAGQKIYGEKLKEMDTVLGTKLTSGIYLVTVKNGGINTNEKVILK